MSLNQKHKGPFYIEELGGFLGLFKKKHQICSACREVAAYRWD